MSLKPEEVPKAIRGEEIWTNDPIEGKLKYI